MSLIKYKSKYSNLVVSGCSFTINESANSHVAWANCFAVWAGMSISNLAVCGAGNQHIANSIILHLEKNRPDPANTLVLPMWSGVARVDWITDRSMLKDNRDWRYQYRYDQYNDLTTNMQTADSRLKSAFEQQGVYQGQESQALNTWLAITALTNYLEQHGYTYYYTAYQDIFSSKRDNLSAMLFKIDLKLDSDKWITTQHEEFFGEFAEARKLVNSDGWHPSTEGHELWVNEILEPKLINKGIIHD